MTGAASAKAAIRGSGALNFGGLGSAFGQTRGSGEFSFQGSSNADGIAEGEESFEIVGFALSNANWRDITIVIGKLVESKIVAETAFQRLRVGSVRNGRISAG